MEEWKKVRLDEIIDFNPTERIPKGTIAKKIAMEKLEPFTRDIEEYELLEFKGGAKFRNGDTLMARITPSLENGKTAKIQLLDDEEVGFGSTEFIVARAIDGISDENFIYYLMLEPKVRETAIKSMVGSSGRQRVQLDVLKKYEILCPPISEQRKIGKVLKVIDDKIKNNKQINHHLAEMISACYEKLISETNNIGFIEDLGQIVGGGTPSKKIDEYYGDEIPWLTPKDLSNCNLLYTKCGENSITQLGYDKSSAKLMPTHSILFSSRAPIGYLTIADNEISTNQGFKSIVPHKDIPYTFVYETLKHETVNIEHSAGGSTFKEISGTQLKKHKIPLPNKDELQVFHLTVEPFFIETREYELQNQQLQILRNTLLPKLISGEIFINN